MEMRLQVVPAGDNMKWDRKGKKGETEDDRARDAPTQILLHSSSPFTALKNVGRSVQPQIINSGIQQQPEIIIGVIQQRPDARLQRSIKADRPPGDRGHERAKEREKNAGVAAVSPDDVVVVSQVEPLAVLSGVVHHAHPAHEVHQLLPGGVVQVISALMAPVPVDPIQPEPAARGAPVRHPGSSASVLLQSWIICFSPGSSASVLLQSWIICFSPGSSVSVLLQSCFSPGSSASVLDHLLQSCFSPGSSVSVLDHLFQSCFSPASVLDHLLQSWIICFSPASVLDHLFQSWIICFSPASVLLQSWIICFSPGSSASVLDHLLQSCFSPASVLLQSCFKSLHNTNRRFTISKDLLSFIIGQRRGENPGSERCIPAGGWERKVLIPGRRRASSRCSWNSLQTDKTDRQTDRQVDRQVDRQAAGRQEPGFNPPNKDPP
ncbi:hypothetical protein NQZ68_022674 [Dissostichus eleginoides]|nr:hypothetical protein NQZ68_022674 [Dissostichus eleginoides]